MIDSIARKRCQKIHRLDISGESSTVARCMDMRLSSDPLSVNQGIPRKNMPQIEGDPRAFVQWLKQKGIESHRKTIQAEDLRATQCELDAEKVEDILKDHLGESDGMRGAADGIIVSGDYFILDGHHRWASAFIWDPSTEIECLCVDWPMVAEGTEGLLDKARDYSSK